MEGHSCLQPFPDFPLYSENGYCIVQAIMTLEVFLALAKDIKGLEKDIGEQNTSFSEKDATVRFTRSLSKSKHLAYI